MVEIDLTKSNKAAPVNAPIAFSFQAGHLGRRVTEQRRSAASHER